MKVPPTLAFILIACSSALGQAQPRAAPFEVASIKPHEGPQPEGGGKLTISGPRLTFEYWSDFGLIMWAYNVKRYQISTAIPLDPRPYDIVAKAEGDRSPATEEFRVMMQLLLADRFRLKAHRETREMPVYALVIGKNGSKLKRSLPEVDPETRTVLDGTRIFHVTMTKASADDLAEHILYNAGLDRPVVNQTALTGAYAIEMRYTPAWRMGGASETDADVISILRAVQQLGLELVPRIATCEIIVVDHVEKPSAN